MRFLSVVVVAVAIPAALAAQDAVTTLPGNYRIDFENEYVRVTRVHYPAHATLPGHTHTSLPTAYVYLSDSGPVAFKHVGHKAFAATRPPTVARAFRLFRGLEEVHAVENLSDTPSHFLRVEFKTEVIGDPRTLRGRFLPPKHPAPPSKVEFENAQVRITRFVSASTIEPSASPALFISLDAADMGQAAWLPAGAVHRAPGDAFEGLLFELKTGVKAC